MAWVEKTGRKVWWVRYRRNNGTEGSIGGFHDPKTANDYANDMECDQRRGLWLDPAGAKTSVAAWAGAWVETLDVETRTEENYRSYLRLHILPHWGHYGLGEVTALDVTAWEKQLHRQLREVDIQVVHRWPSRPRPVGQSGNALGTEPVAPLTNGIDVHVEVRGNRGVGLTTPCRQHDLGTQHHPLRRGLFTHDLFKTPTATPG